MSQLSEFNRNVIEEFRANGGKVGGMFANASILLLTTTGAKSGRSYTTPLVYSKDGERIVVIASKAGADTNPDWYHNLKAHPLVTVELGTVRFQARAAITAGEERERLFNRQAAQWPAFNDYQARTKRQIPVIVLTRAD